MTRRELERIRRQYKSVKVLVTMEVLFHLLPSFISLFLPEPYNVWGILWLLFGGVVILPVYNLVALVFGLEWRFPIPEYLDYDDRCSRGPAKIDYSCPNSAGYWLDQDRIHRY